EGGHVHVYPGNYEDYLYRKESGGALTGPLPSSNGSKAAVATVAEIEVADKEKAKRLNPIKLRQMQERHASLEEEIPRIESEIAETEHALGKFVSMEETQKLTRKLEDLRARNEVLTAEWEELTLLLEEQSMA